ncbi:threonine aspartase 1 isoform X6 [Parus major]|uniref:threonine aspartase 1 isoform X6 n=1 Tax=Parus major TaxID=9157 RepID=UPI000771126C|nr:threonine aspartase 1 isoform X6 [Parus major]
MIMEKGISSVEVLPSKSSQVTAVKVVVKEPEAKQTQRGKRVGFVLVHAGAGYHSESKAKEYKHVCKRACQKAIEKLQAGALATDAVTAALIELEDSPFTNAGLGSNLNLLGEIECDASIMDGKSLNFGAVGALSGIKNPVSVANRLLCEGQKGKLSAGRIPPCFLVGEGAYRWAVDHGIPACPPGIMATRFSLAAFKRNKRKLELAEKVETDLIQLKKRRQSNEKENDSGTLDTVGAVVVDQEGNVAAAVSSGGLALKHPGRVGQLFMVVAAGLKIQELITLIPLLLWRAPCPDHTGQRMFMCFANRGCPPSSPRDYAKQVYWTLQVSAEPWESFQLGNAWLRQ